MKNCSIVYAIVIGDRCLKSNKYTKEFLSDFPHFDGSGPAARVLRVVSGRARHAAGFGCLGQLVLLNPLEELRLGGVLAPAVAQDGPLQSVEREVVLCAGFLAGCSRKGFAFVSVG